MIQLIKNWSNLQERLKNKLMQRNQTDGGTSADLNARDEITQRILGETNPVLNMVPGAWPAPPCSPRAARPTSSTSSEGSLSSSGPAPTSSTPVTVPTTPRFPPVDCTTRKRRRIDLAPPPPLAGDIPQQYKSAKLAYYEAGRAYFDEARQYYKQMNEYCRKQEEQIVFDSVYAEVNRSDRSRRSSF